MLEEYYTLSVIGKAGLGTPHMDGNMRLCTATAAAAMKESFGTDGQPGSYDDVEHTDALFLFGHNVAATQTVLWARMLDRLEGDDPPWTQAELADQLSPWAWRHWSATVEIPRGGVTVLARAWDSSAALQPERPEHVWNPKGYVNNSWARVHLHGV